MKDWIIYTEDGAQHDVKATTLRTALRNFPIEKGRIVGAIRADFVAMPTATDVPFYAILLRNRSYVPKEDE